MKKLAKYSLTGLAIGGLILLPGLQTYAATTQSANTIINGLIGSTITVSSTGTVSMNLSPTGSSVTSIGKDTVTVNSNDVDGYNLTLNVNSATDDKLTNSAASSTIDSTSGTYAAPAVLALNSWGYRVDGLGTFGAGSTAVVDSVASSPLFFAKVPLSASPQNIRSTTTTATNSTTDVYYGIKVDASKPNGTYTNTVVYTATVK